MSVSNTSFAALLNAANEIPDVPLPPAGPSVLKIADMTLYQPREDGQSPRVSTRLVYGGPLDPSTAGDINPRDYETIFHTNWLGTAKDNSTFAELVRAAGAGGIAPCVSDGNGGIALNPEMVEAVKGREVTATLKHGVNKQSQQPEVRLFNFAALG